MKKRNRVQVILAALAVLALTGCSVARPVEPQALPDAGQSAHQQLPAVSQTGPQNPPDVSQPAPQTTPAPEAPASQGQPAEKRLTPEQAKVIALSHAGFTAGQVTGLRVEFDVDDGVPEYEVEFHVGGVEYDYEIHAYTGATLKSQKERDD